MNFTRFLFLSYFIEKITQSVVLTQGSTATIKIASILLRIKFPMCSYPCAYAFH